MFQDLTGWIVICGGKYNAVCTYFILHYNYGGFFLNKIYKQWSTMPLISTKRTIISHPNSLNIEKTMTYEVGNQYPGLWQAQICGGLNILVHTCFSNIRVKVHESCIKFNFKSIVSTYIIQSRKRYHFAFVYVWRNKILNILLRLKRFYFFYLYIKFIFWNRFY